MTLIPQVPVQQLGELFAPHGITVSERGPGIILQRTSDGAAYRLIPTRDGFARGTHLFYACQRFGLDPYGVVFG